MIPSIGRIVIYKTTEAERAGLKAMGCHNTQKELPAVIVSQWGGENPHAGTAVNLKVMIDGNLPDMWKTSVCVGEAEGSWHWPIINNGTITLGTSSNGTANLNSSIPTT